MDSRGKTTHTPIKDEFQGNRSRENNIRAVSGPWEGKEDVIVEFVTLDGETEYMTKEEKKAKYVSGKTIEIIMEAKPRPEKEITSLLDIDVVKEMLEFEDFLMNLSMPVPDTSVTNKTDETFR